MKINWAERWMVNSPIRVFAQRRLISWFKQTMGLAGGAKILEVGCGRGVGARMLWDALQPSVLQAMDLDQEMIRKARRQGRQDNHNRIFFYVGDAVSLPYPPETFDIVFGFGVLHHLPDWRRGLAEISRVLKNGGVYFLEEFYPALILNPVFKRIFRHPEEDRFYSGDLKQALTEMQFTMLRIKEQECFGILAVCRKDSDQLPVISKQ